MVNVHNIYEEEKKDSRCKRCDLMISHFFLEKEDECLDGHSFISSPHIVNNRFITLSGLSDPIPCPT